MSELLYGKMAQYYMNNAYDENQRVNSTSCRFLQSISSHDVSSSELSKSRKVNVMGTISTIPSRCFIFVSISRTWQTRDVQSAIGTASSSSCTNFSTSRIRNDAFLLATALFTFDQINSIEFSSQCRTGVKILLHLKKKPCPYE